MNDRRLETKEKKRERENFNRTNTIIKVGEKVSRLRIRLYKITSRDSGEGEEARYSLSRALCSTRSLGKI